MTPDMEDVLERVQWDGLRGANLLITGGTGWFGRWLVESALLADERLQLGLRVTTLARSTPIWLPRQVKFIRADAAHYLCSDDYTHVIHAALAGASRFQVGIRLLTSSGAVYDNPLTPLGCSKLEDETGWGGKVARCFSFVGPYMPLDRYAIGNFIWNVLKGGPIRLTSDGTAVRTYMHMADLTVALWHILLKGDTQPYDVGSDQPVSLLEVAHLIADMAHTSVEVGSGVPERSYYVPRSAHCIRQTIPLEDAIRRTLDWYKQ